MSIAVMSSVWKHSRAGHGSLLVLLAISDFANDDGEAYPSVETLRVKARLSERAVQNAIRELAMLGELEIDAGKGRNGTNLYRVQVLPPAEIAPPQKRTETPAEIAPKPSVTVKDSVSGEGQSEPSRKTKMLPTTPAAIRISTLFGRRLTTPWQKDEVKAFKELQPMDIDDLALLETYYAFERQKGGNGMHRRDLKTLLNNYSGELDRARAWRDNSKAHERIKGSSTNGTSKDAAAGTANEGRSSQYAGVGRISSV